MSCVDFVQKTITSLSTDQFKECRELLFDEYLSLSVIQKEDMTVSILGEKLCDY